MFDALEKITEEDNTAELERLTDLLAQTFEEYAAKTASLNAVHETADLKEMSERIRIQETLWQKDIHRQKNLIQKVKRNADALSKLSMQVSKSKKIREAYGGGADESSVLSSQG